MPSVSRVDTTPKVLPCEVLRWAVIALITPPWKPLSRAPAFDDRNKAQEYPHILLFFIGQHAVWHAVPHLRFLLILITTSSDPGLGVRHIHPPLRERGNVLSSTKPTPSLKDTPFGGIECTGREKNYCQSRCHCSATGQIICHKKHKKLAPPTMAFLEEKLTAMCSPECRCKIDGPRIHGSTTYKEWFRLVREQGQGWSNPER